jgi:L-threonylcarbamoyladenylate synthase
MCDVLCDVLRAMCDVQCDVLRAMASEQLRRAVEVLRKGGVVAYPTDTLYGLAVDPRSGDAVAKLFAVKARDPGHAIPLIAADEAQAALAGTFTDAAWRLARAFWPGPLSIVLDAAPGIDAQILAADGSVAVRVPASDSARELARAFGFCVTATSANLSGAPSTASSDVVRSTLGARVDFVLDVGDAPGGPPSTIVDVRRRVPRLLRAGAVPWNRVLESLE